MSEEKEAASESGHEPDKQEALKEKLKDLGVMKDDNAPPPKPKAPWLHSKWMIMTAVVAALVFWWWYTGDMDPSTSSTAHNASKTSPSLYAPHTPGARYGSGYGPGYDQGAYPPPPYMQGRPGMMPPPMTNESAARNSSSSKDGATSDQKTDQQTVPADNADVSSSASAYSGWGMQGPNGGRFVPPPPPAGPPPGYYGPPPGYYGPPPGYYGPPPGYYGPPPGYYGPPAGYAGSYPQQ